MTALHHDDPARDGNVDTDTYFTQMRELAAEVGDDGLHTIPTDVLEAAEREADQR